MIGDAESTMPLDQLDASPFSKSSKEMICSSTELEGQPPVKEGRDGCRLMLCDTVGASDGRLVGCVEGTVIGRPEQANIWMLSSPMASLLRAPLRSLVMSICNELVESKYATGISTLNVCIWCMNCASPVGPEAGRDVLRY